MKSKFNLWACICEALKRIEALENAQPPVVSYAPLYEYQTIWAEESGALNANSAEWSFGNGATGFMGIPVDEDWEVVSMFFHADTYAATATVQVDLMNYGNMPSNAAANTVASISLANATDGGGATNNAYKYVTLTAPIPVPANAVLGFITRNNVGNKSDCRVGVRLRRKVRDVVIDVNTN